MNLTQSSILIYGVVTKGTNKLTSPVVPIKLTTKSDQFRNWKISTGTCTMVPLTLGAGVEQSIDNYIALANTTPVYKYLIYDPGSSTKPPSWNGSNTAPTGTASGPTIFSNPTTLALQPTITIISINSTTNFTSPFPITLGTTVTLTYKINNFPFNTDLQIIVGNPSDTTNKQQRTIFSFPVTATTTVGAASSSSITFSVFYDSVINNPNIYLSSYGSFTSNKIPIILNTTNINEVSMSTDGTNKAIVTISQNPSTPNVIPSQLVFINAYNNTSLINNLEITYNTSYPDNKFYTILNGFGSSLNIINASITLSKINFNLPLQLVFAVAGSIPTIAAFTNVPKKKKTKELEPFYGNLLVEHLTVMPSPTTNHIYLDTYKIDLSQSTLNPVININLMCTGYTHIYIQNLVLVFGNNKLDNIKFNINFITDVISTGSIYYQISNITIIGLLNTQISLIKKIPGLTNVNYSMPSMINGKYALTTSLIYSNGYYKLAETYNSQLSKLVASTIVPPISAPAILAPASESTEMPTWQIILIVLFVLCIIGGGVYAYFKFIKPQNNK
jgi:hypothetical protein